MNIQRIPPPSLAARIQDGLEQLKRAGTYQEARVLERPSMRGRAWAGVRW